MALFDKKSNEYSAKYSQYYPLIYSIINSRLGNADDTQDICQEVFLLYFDKFEQVENHRSWLISTANYLLQNFYRKKSGKESNIEDPSAESRLKYENGARDTRLLINDAIQDMNNFEDERDKILFDLVAVYKYKYKEAAELLGLSVRQVRYRYQTIKQKLMQHFRDKGISKLEDIL